MPEKMPVESARPSRRTPERSGEVDLTASPFSKARWDDADQTWTYLPSRSPTMHQVERRALRLAPSGESILILGETGSGKDLLARLIHENSARRGRPFIHVNCAALSESLLESELFGHVRGAYTGASESQHGLFEAANGGTIFLDEIGELPPKLQAKLLHVLQERRLLRVGGRQPVKVDVRVLSATNRDLKEAIKSGGFRRDLFYRLGVVSLNIPPLRDRREDLSPLVECLFRKYARLYNRPELTGPDGGLLEAIQAWSWPGNIRELENMVKRVMLLGESDRVLEDCEFTQPEDRPAMTVDEPPPPLEVTGLSLHEVSRRAQHLAEREAILRALTRCDWNRRRAARDLKISYRSLLYKIKDYTLRPGSSDTRDDH
jgi:transcriptional regulator with PAS, ATPase and Fis domain